MLKAIRSGVRGLLEGLVGRHRLNDSWLYAVYLRVFRSAHYQRMQTERRFFGALFREVPTKLVFDIGANHGHKAKLFSRHAETVVCLEPGEDAVNSLRSRFRGKDAVVIVAKGVGSREGEAVFHEFDTESAYSTFSEKWSQTVEENHRDGGDSRPVCRTRTVPVTTVDRLIAEFGRPDYIKIDVEGYELPVVQGLSQAVPLTSFECNLPEFRDETLGVIARLTELDRAARFNFCVTEPPARFERGEWISGAEMCALVSSGNFRFMEVYCRMDPDSTTSQTGRHL